MKRGGASRGFTVIEVVIVLAISGGLFVSAVLMISGRQNQTAFEQASRQIQSQMQQILNEVSTGYYPNSQSFECEAGASNQPPVLSSGTVEQGANTDCIFVGKAVQFEVADTDPQQFAIYTIAGLKRGGPGSSESASLAHAHPMLVASSPSHDDPDYPDNSYNEKLQNGLTVSRAWYCDISCNEDNLGDFHDIGSIAFVNGLAQFDGSGQILSGASSVSVVAANNTSGATALGLSKSATVEALNSDGGNRLATGILNPSGGIFVCFESGGTEDYALLQIGGSGRDLTITLTIRDKTPVTEAMCASS